jgi:hypothetical protein
MPAASAGAAISNSGWRTAGDEAHPGEPAAHRPPTPAATRQSDRTVRQRAQFLSQRCELRGLAGAVEQLQPDHVAARDLTVGDRLIKCGAQPAADPTGPDPRAGVSQLHLHEPTWTAQLLQHVRGQVGEVALQFPGSGVSGVSRSGVSVLCTSSRSVGGVLTIGKLGASVQLRVAMCYI